MASYVTNHELQSVTTRRGYTYSFHYRVATSGKLTILFLHGFPSTHRDWTSQIDCFGKEGYGIIVPDLLGYGQTSALEDPREYKLKDIAEDVIDILDAHQVGKVVGVAHDWHVPPLRLA
jgi:soluble epoxide hydrolase / lipid-phosphate phosphatase